MPALVLFSGGQDSTTCLFWAKRHFDRVETVGFHYGQRHAVELRQAQKIADDAKVPFKVFDLRGLLGNSSLTDADRPTVGSHPQEATLPSTFVPGRNLLFLSIAASYAYSIDCFDLVTGVCETDFSGYPDCRKVFIESAQSTLTLAMAPKEFRIHTPLMHLDKADTFQLAEDLGVLEIILEDTHTDYHGDRSQRHPWGYGRLDNEASRLRARGWEEFLKRRRSNA